MEAYAKVEKLVEATGVTYEDARNSLRACDEDMIEAMIYLEKLGKVTTYKPNYDTTDPRFAPITEAEMEAAAARRDAREAEARKSAKEIKAELKAEKKAEKYERKAEKFERKAERAARKARQSSSFGEFIGKVIRFLTHNKLVISKEGEKFASIPLLAVLIICSISFGFALVAGFVSLMCGYEYSFEGTSESEYETY